MVTTKCPNPSCGKSFDVSEEYLGRSGRCKQCGTRFTVSQSGEGQPSTDPGPAPTPLSTAPINGDIPERLGRFEIRTRLGAGAFGTVYRAFDPVLNREVALKVPQAGTLQSPKTVQRFLREARAAAQLRHPHIVPVYDAGTDGPHHYIASAFIEGQTLAAVIDANDKGLEPRRAAQIVLDLAKALNYAHGRGIVHRDVKPANVMIDAEGQPQLMDFGLARFELSEEKLTQEGAILGTPAYMAPEQVQDGRSASAASDQYSLGVVLYELLCGQTPFSGPAQILLFNAVHKPPPLLRDHNTATPRDLETICLKALAKLPTERYANCDELADDLNRWLLDEPIHARRISAIEQVVRLARRNPVTAGLAAAFTVALLLGTIISLSYAGLARARAIEAAEHLKTAKEQTILADAKTKEAVANAEQARLSAEDARTNAALYKQEKIRADTKSTEALGNAEKERQERIRADIKAAEALASTLQERRANEQRQHFFYSASFRAARDLLDRHDLVHAFPFLQEITSTSSQSSDLRGLEWPILQRQIGWVGTSRIDPKLVDQIRKKVKVISLVEKQVGVISPDGTLIALPDLQPLPQPQRFPSIPGPFGRPGNPEISGPNGSLRIVEISSGREIVKLKMSEEAEKEGLGEPDVGSPVLAMPPVDLDVMPGTIRGRSRNGSKALDIQMVFTSDGTQLITGDSEVRFWDLHTGKLTRRIAILRETENTLDRSSFPPTAPAPNIQALTLSGDGAFLVLMMRLRSGRDPRVRAIDLANGNMQDFVIPTESELSNGMRGGVPNRALDRAGPHHLVCSRDGRFVAISTQSSLLGLSATQKGWSKDYEGSRATNSTKSICNAIAISPDGTRLAVADDNLHILDASTGAILLNLTIPGGGPVTDVAFSEDGQRLAAAGTAIQIWETVSGRLTHTLPGNSFVRFRANGQGQIVGIGPDSVNVWEQRAEPFTRPLRGHVGPVSGLAFNSDGTRLASVGDDRSLRIWDVKTCKPLVVRKESTTRLAQVIYSPDNSLIATVGDQGHLQICDASNGDVRHTLTTSYPDWLNRVQKNSPPPVDDTRYRDFKANLFPFSMAFSPDNLRLIAVEGHGEARAWDTRTGASIKIPVEPDGNFRYDSSRPRPSSRGIVSPAASYLAMTPACETAVINEVSSSKIVARLNISVQDGYPFRRMAFSPNAKRLASFDEGSTVYLWEIPDGKLLSVIREEQGSIDEVAFSSDGRRFVTATSQAAIRIWDSTTGQLLLTIKGPEKGVRSLVLSPNGHTLAVASLGGSITLWDTSPRLMESTPGPGGIR